MIKLEGKDTPGYLSLFVEAYGLSNIDLRYISGEFKTPDYVYGPSGSYDYSGGMVASVGYDGKLPGEVTGEFSGDISENLAVPGQLRYQFEWDARPSVSTAAQPMGYIAPFPETGNTQLGNSSQLGFGAIPGSSPWNRGLAQYKLIQVDEPTPGAYTYNAGTNINALHHTGAQPSATVTMSGSLDATNSSGGSTAVSHADFDVTLTYETSIFYILSPITPAKAASVFYGLSTNPLKTPLNGSSKFGQSGYDAAAYIESLTTRSGVVQGDLTTGYTLTSRARIYGAICIRRMTSARWQVTGQKSGTWPALGFPIYTAAANKFVATPTPAVKYLVQNSATIPAWVTQTPY